MELKLKGRATAICFADDLTFIVGAMKDVQDKRIDEKAGFRNGRKKNWFCFRMNIV